MSMTTWVLRMLGDPPVKLHVTPGHVFRIGRDTEADLCLDDKLVSRRHCEAIVTRDGRLEVKDLGSRNGTRLNGRPLVGAVVVKPGDELKVGSATLIVEEPRVISGVVSFAEPEANAGLADESPALGDEALPLPPPKPPTVSAGGTGRATKSQGGAPPAAAAPAGSVRGYELVSEVSRGRTGIIYRARAEARGPLRGPEGPSQGEGRDVLLKILDTDWASSENAAARFEAEAGALGKIDHPNIVRLGELGGDKQRRFYTMEWVEGETLEAKMRRKPLEAREAIAIAVQVARGLGVAHATGIVHRDIAPASILVTPEGVAKLFDFAFVKTEGEMPSLTNLGDVVGDLRYSSPEQAGNPRAVDHRSDLYALGATLFHAIAGRPPIEGRNYLDTYRKIVQEQAPPLAEVVPGARPRLTQAVARLLEKDSEKRFQSGADVAQALAEALLEAVIAARKLAPPPGVGIGADFHGVELLELVQILGGRRATGVLVIQEPGFEGEIRFRQGEIVGAKAPGEERTLFATNAILDLPRGTFAFRVAPSVPAPLSGPPLSAAELALDALRRRRGGREREGGSAPSAPAENGGPDGALQAGIIFEEHGP